MSNNDLYCKKCKSHHHPAECLLDANMEDWERIISEYMTEGFQEYLDECLEQIRERVDTKVAQAKQEVYAECARELSDLWITGLIVMTSHQQDEKERGRAITERQYKELTTKWQSKGSCAGKNSLKIETR